VAGEECGGRLDGAVDLHVRKRVAAGLFHAFTPALRAA
jgi:hypothetical protein